MDLLDFSKNEDQLIQHLQETDDAINNVIPQIGLNGKPVLSKKAREKHSQKLESIKSKELSNNYKLLLVNQKILETLQKIQRDLIDEQDTSIKHKPKSSGASGVLGSGLSGEGETGWDQSLSSNDFTFFDLPNRRTKDPKKTKDKTNKKTDKKTKKSKDIKTTKTTKNTKKPKKPPKPKKPTKINLIKDVVKNTAKHGGDIVKNGAKTLTKTAANVAKTSVRLGANALSKLALPLTAMLALYDGWNGWNEAGENLGIDEKDLTLTNKASSAAASMASGLTLGLVDEKNLAQGINNLLGGNDAIEKYEELGIIDHETFGDSKITDWDKLSQLPPEEIQKIIDIDDWSDEDLKRLNEIKNNPQPIKPIKEKTETLPSTIKTNIGDNALKEQSNVITKDIKTTVKNAAKTEKDLSKITMNSSSKEIAALTSEEITKLIETTTDKRLVARLKTFEIARLEIDKAIKENKVLPIKEQKELLAELFNGVRESIDKTRKTKDKNGQIDVLTLRSMLDYGTYIKLKYEELDNKKQITEQPQSISESSTPQINLTPTKISNFTPTGPTFSQQLNTGLAMTTGFSVFEPFTLTPSDTKFNPNDRIGVLSKKYEVGRGGVGTISSGHGDPGGKSYGSWQLSSNAGTLGDFVKFAPGEIGEQLRKYPLTSPDFDKAWKSIAEQDPNGFEKLQYDYLYQKNYLPVLNYAKGLGIDTNSITMQNVLWSQAIQHGYNGNKTILNNAIQAVGKNADPITMINAIYNARSKYVNGLTKMEASTKQSLLNRYKSEGSDALAMLQSEKSGDLGTPEKPNVSNENVPNIAGPTLQETETQAETNKTISETRVDAANANMSQAETNKTNILIQQNIQQQNLKQQKTQTDAEQSTEDENYDQTFVLQ